MTAKRPHKKGYLRNHQQSWIWGRHAVLEAIRSRRWSPLEIRYSSELPNEMKREIREFCSQAGVTAESCDNTRLKQLTGSSAHQGLIARMPDYPYLPERELLDLARKGCTVLILDCIQDAFNFGACIRSAEAMGLDAVLVAQRNQSAMTSQVVRSSAGAVHSIPVCQIDDLTRVLIELKQLGLKVVGASEKSQQVLSDFDFRGPTAILVGNEHSGIDPQRQELCDALLQIPLSGKTSSLNVAVATGIVLYEVARQRSAD